MADDKNRTSEIRLKVQLDENNIPVTIDWMAEDGQLQHEGKAMMFSVWDKKETTTLRVDLWTKEMYVEEMNQFFMESLITMADVFERATGEGEMASEMRDFGKYFGERMEVLKREG